MGVPFLFVGFHCFGDVRQFAGQYVAGEDLVGVGGVVVEEDGHFFLTEFRGDAYAPDQAREWSVWAVEYDGDGIVGAVELESGVLA